MNEPGSVEDQICHYENKLAYEIDAWDLNILLDSSEEVVVIDVRSADAFDREHIVGAVSLPHREMTTERTAFLDRKAKIVTYCDGVGCNGSTKGALKMARLGFRVVELIGGIVWWKRDGYPTHTDAGNSSGDSCGCG